MFYKHTLLLKMNSMILSNKYKHFHMKKKCLQRNFNTENLTASTQCMSSFNSFVFQFLCQFLLISLKFRPVSLSANHCLFILFKFVWITFCLLYPVSSVAKAAKVFISSNEHCCFFFLCFSRFLLFPILSAPKSKVSRRRRHFYIVNIQIYNELSLSISCSFNEIYTQVCSWPNTLFHFIKLAFMHPNISILTFSLFHFHPIWSQPLYILVLFNYNHCCGYRCSIHFAMTRPNYHLTNAIYD